MRILLADDEPIFLETLSRRLTQKGNIVEVADNGRDAYAKYTAAPDEFDLIIADIKMPRMDGLDLLRELRDNDHHIPVIIMSGHGDLQRAVEALRLGAFDYLIKPLELNRLYSSLSRLEGAIHKQERVFSLIPHLKGDVEITIPSQVNYVESVASYLSGLIEPLRQYYRIDSYRIYLCLQEALANAILHGNLELPSEIKEKSWEEFDRLRIERENDDLYSKRQITIHFSFTSTQMTFEITDEGAGFDTTHLPGLHNPEVLLSSGRGIVYISSFMDEVTWNKSGNQIRMTKKFQLEE